MKVALFYHSLLSDWNHGNAHFLRGVASELVARGAEVAVYEPADAWSLTNLQREHGAGPLETFRKVYPQLRSVRYDLATLELEAVLEEANLVIVHEWNDPELVHRLGEHRRRHGQFRLLFHDTHHRAVTDRQSMAAYDLRHYDGVLAFGEVLRQLYLDEGWTQRAWTWHEAADVRVFRPRPSEGLEGDLVWIGNWGDEERSTELHTFLLEPVRKLGLQARVHGVRYPPEARQALEASGISYGGWLPNFCVPRVFARYRVTVHVPRQPYVRALPGIPTIRPFEALACGIPLVSSPWDDVEGLFTAGRDYLVAHDGEEMRRHLQAVLEDGDLARALAQHGRQTILAKHTCAHRVDELFAVADELGLDTVALASPVREGEPSP